MGFNDQFALQKILNGPCPFWSWLFSISGRALALGDGCCGAWDFPLYGRQIRAR
jgi:hypothetical protein